MLYVKDSDSSTTGTCPIDLELTIFLIIVLRDGRGFDALATPESWAVEFKSFEVFAT